MPDDNALDQTRSPMNNPFIKAKTPDKCPECGYGFRALSNHINHSVTCSRIDLESARHHLHLNAEAQKRAAFWRAKDRERAMLWEGKFHVLRHENNRLRKENVALKLSGQPPKQHP